LSDTIAANLHLPVDANRIYSRRPIPRAATRICDILEIELEKLKSIATQHRKAAYGRAQKEYYLNENWKAIQRNLDRRKSELTAEEKD